MAIRDRGEGNEKRKDRLAKLKKGPGVFVYDGLGFDVEAIPTVLKIGRNVPVLDSEGMPVVDDSGRQVFEKQGKIVRDSKGQPVLGGVPKIKKTPLDVFEVRGMKFPKGEPVEVKDPSIALKLRCLERFEEVEAIEVVEADGDEFEATPKKRGKPGPKPKSKPEAEPEAKPEE